MPKRLAATLCALLMFAPALAVITASPAGAHDVYYDKSVQRQRCDYDPLSGQNFNCRTVTVTVRAPAHHSHARVCPDGTTGTPPNCLPVPSDNSRRGTQTDKTDKTDKTDSGTKGTRSNRGTDKTDKGDGTDKTDKGTGTKGTRSNRGTDKTDKTDGTGTKGTRSNRNDCPKLLGTHPHLDRDQHQHGDHGCHPSASGHRHSDGTKHTSGDENDDMATGFKVIFKGVDLYREGTGEVVCAAAAGGASSKLLNAIGKGGSRALKWLTGVTVEARVTSPCDWLWNKWIENTKKYLPDGSGNQNDGNGQGEGGDSQQQTPTPEADPIPERPNTAQWAKEWQRWQAAKDSLSTAERDAAKARWNQVQCNYHSRRGRTGYCR